VKNFFLTICETTFDERQELPSATFALNGSQIVLSNVAPPLLQFLLMEAAGKTVSKIGELTICDSLVFQDEQCDLMTSTFVDPITPRQVDFWVEKKRFVIRQTREAYSVDGTRLDIWKSLNEVATDDFENLVELRKAKSRKQLEMLFPKNSNINEVKRNAWERFLQPLPVVEVSSYLKVSVDTNISSSIFSIQN